MQLAQGPRSRRGGEWILQTEPGPQEAPLAPWPCLKPTLGWEPRPLARGCPGLLVTLGPWSWPGQRVGLCWLGAWPTPPHTIP